jgi:hypothetical protein
MRTRHLVGVCPKRWRTTTLINHADAYPVDAAKRDWDKGELNRVWVGDIEKPVMGTKDLRFFDARDDVMLPDGHARRGMSVVAALSEWLIHTNRRTGGSWGQRYEHRVPTSDLTPVADDGTTGTTVDFQPGIAILVSPGLMAPELTRVASWPQLRVEVVDERPS